MSVKRRGGDADGNWFYRFSYKGSDHCEGGFPNKQQAAEAERLARNEVIARTLHPEEGSTHMTFRQAGEWWLKEYVPTKVDDTDASRVPFMIDYFDRKPLKDIRPNEIVTFLSEIPRLRGYKISDHTKNSYRALIHAIYERMIRMQMYRGQNPVRFVDKIKVPRSRTRFFYPAEEKILTPAMALNPAIFAFYMVGLGTGMRIGEMKCILVKHVDFTQGHIFIPKPKNKRSRYVPLEDGELLDLLRSLAANKDPEALLMPHWGYTYILEHFKAICDSVGIRFQNGEGVHVMRHTFAYNLLSQGESLYKVSLLLGHSSQDVTQQHYGHLAAQDLRDVIRRAKPFISSSRISSSVELTSRIINGATGVLQ